jgi:tyrosine-protein phosphatase SIW14
MFSKASALLLASALLVNGAPLQARLIRHPNRPDCNPTEITPKDIRGFHRVDQDLYRGGHPSCSGYAKLQALGIRTIIDLQGGLERKIERCKVKGAADNNGQFRFIPFDIKLYQTAVTGVSEARVNSLFALIAQAPKPIFINCKFGEDRTGMVIAIYRMKRGEMNYQEARSEALYYGFEPRLCGLNKTLKRYRDPQKLAALPMPDPSPPPLSSVCRPMRSAD